MKLLIIAIVTTASLLAQSSTVTAANSTGTVSGSINLAIAPSVATISCTPNILDKGVPVSCTITLDFPVPAGRTLTLPITVTAPPGVTVNASPISVTIPAGSNSCGSATAPCFTVTRP